MPDGSLMAIQICKPDKLIDAIFTIARDKGPEKFKGKELEYLQGWGMVDKEGNAFDYTSTQDVRPSEIVNALKPDKDPMKGWIETDKERRLKAVKGFIRYVMPVTFDADV